MKKKFEIPTIREIEEFDKARKLYPGIKRGNPTELKNFRTKHSDWKQSLLLLYSAIENQIRCRKWATVENNRRRDFRRQPIFIPPWKNFKTWINQRCWEDSLLPEYLEHQQAAAKALEQGKKDKIRRHEALKAERGNYWRSLSVPELLEYLKTWPNHRQAILELRPDALAND